MQEPSSGFSWDSFVKDGIGAIKDATVAKYQAEVSKSATKQAQMQSAVSAPINQTTTTGGNVGMPSMGGGMMLGAGLVGGVVLLLVLLKRR